MVMDDKHCVFVWLLKLIVSKLTINFKRYADMAQSVAHLIGSEEVTSSILVVSTKKALVLRLF